MYLDDIIIISSTYEKHLEILETALDRLHRAGLTLSKEKCHFCRPQLRYLGYIVDEHGLHVDPDKVDAILLITPPKDVREIRRFVGMASWYRRFISNFATFMTPLTCLTKKKRDI